jgi:hypothetical protein
LDRVRRTDIDDLPFADTLVVHEGVPFSGVARELAPDGRVLEATPYRRGAVHGVAVTFHACGALASEKLVLFGTLVWRRCYDRDGRLVDRHELPADDPRYHRVVQRSLEETLSPSVTRLTL